METINAHIESVSLGYEDHGILTSYICWRGSSYGGGFGGLCMIGPCLDIWVREILRTLDVDDWSKVNGKLIRVRIEGGGLGGRAVAIGHIIEDRWVTLEELQAKMGAAYPNE